MHVPSWLVVENKQTSAFFLLLKRIYNVDKLNESAKESLKINSGHTLLLPLQNFTQIFLWWM